MRRPRAEWFASAALLLASVVTSLATYAYLTRDKRQPGWIDPTLCAAAWSFALVLPIILVYPVLSRHSPAWSRRLSVALGLVWAVVMLTTIVAPLLGAPTGASLERP